MKLSDELAQQLRDCRDTLYIAREESRAAEERIGEAKAKENKAVDARFKLVKSLVKEYGGRSEIDDLYRVLLNYNRYEDARNLSYVMAAYGEPWQGRAETLTELIAVGVFRR